MKVVSIVFNTIKFWAIYVYSGFINVIKGSLSVPFYTKSISLKLCPL